MVSFACSEWILWLSELSERLCHRTGNGKKVAAVGLPKAGS